MSRIGSIPIVTPQTLVGPAPLSMELFNYQQAENTGFTNAAQKQGLLILNVPKHQTKRKLYGWLWSNADVTLDFQVTSKISFSVANTDIGSIPFSIGDSINGGGTTILTPSVSALTSAVLCTSADVLTGVNPIDDCLLLSPGKETPNVPKCLVLYPLRFEGEVEQIRMDFTGMVGSATSARAFIACISTT